jgi:putative hydrolase
VASVHSKLAMEPRAMTRRMVLAVANPNVDVLGHCTGRKVTGRPERRDPPEDLLALALEWGCKVSIDTDAHAPGQLEWQPWGCDLAARMELPTASVVNTWEADELLAWADSHPTG